MLTLPSDPNMDENELKIWDSLVYYTNPFSQSIDIQVKTWRGYETFSMDLALLYIGQPTQGFMSGLARQFVRSVSLPVPGISASAFGSWDADGAPV